MSEREIEALALVAMSLRSKAIARVLNVQPGSVDTLLKRAGRKAGTSDRFHLAALLAKHEPDLIQSAIQRLGLSENALVSLRLAQSGDEAGQADEAETVAPAAVEVEPASRPWVELPPWKKRLYAVVIAACALLATLLLVTLSNHVLVTSPRPRQVGISED